MTWTEDPEGGGILKLDEQFGKDVSMEIEVIVDHEEGLAFGLFWKDKNKLLAVCALSQE